MNPHSLRSISPLAIIRAISINRSLIISLTMREVIGRYRGSAMGLLWSFFNPILMLAVYTFVFSVVFKARWSASSDSKTEFALVLFAGLIIFNLFSECINRAPNLILSNVNYVKKVIFPLETLPVVSLGSALFHFFISFSVWLIFYFYIFGHPSFRIFQLPIILLPLIFTTIGLSWFLSSLGVYLRDISQIIGIITTILMFMTPIFYPLSSIPKNYQTFMKVSPITFTVEQARNVMIWNAPVNWPGWLNHMFIALLVIWLGFAWFEKTRKGFPDVL